MELIRLLVNRWRTNSSVQVSIPLYIAYEDKCICINVTGSRFITEPESNQEEADTRSQTCKSNDQQRNNPYT